MTEFNTIFNVSDGKKHKQTQIHNKGEYVASDEIGVTL